MKLSIPVMFLCGLFGGSVLAAPQESSLSTSAPKLRVLVVAGGGFFETSFFGMLTPFEQIETTLSWSDVEAFGTDIRARADVVVLINRSPSLPEPARAHLRNFVEGGGGVVVVNQALASYGDWPWWYNEVTGGRYLDRPDGDLPSSGFHLGEAIIATPVEKHPVVARLEGLSFHVLDETYRNVSMSASNRVLLRTRNSTSDGPLLWIGPRTDARVVVHTLGYGHGAHLNLAFRHLMEDSILWAGRRIP